MKQNIITALLFFSIVANVFCLSVIVMQDDSIDAEKAKHEVTKVELYELKQTIAEGLCLPRLQCKVIK